jgi:beta-N-acetylhexosaminidase
MSESIEALAGRVICAGFAGRTLPDALEARLAADALGGVILFKRNLGELDEVAGLIERVHAAAARSAKSSRAPLVAIDQEGGRVARLGAPIVKLPPMRRLGERGDAGLTERCGAVLGAQLAACGINVDFAPVLDVDTNPDNPVIGDRSFGRDADTVIEHALAFARGLSTRRVSPPAASTSPVTATRTSTVTSRCLASRTIGRASMKWSSRPSAPRAGWCPRS